MSDLEIARVLLYEKANKVLQFEMLYPVNIIHIVKDFLARGCKNREDYETMIRELFGNDCYNKELLLEN